MEFPQDNGAQPLSPGFNFTPISEELGVRVRMRISDEDRMMVLPGPGDKGIVTDLDTGTKYRVSGKSCGLPRCYCDARISLVTEEVPL